LTGCGYFITFSQFTFEDEIIFAFGGRGADDDDFQF
jgi:hypothetical protein